MTNSQTENAGSEAELENLLRRINALTATPKQSKPVAPGQPQPQPQTPPGQSAVAPQAPPVAAAPGQARQPLPPTANPAAPPSAAAPQGVGPAAAVPPNANRPVPTQQAPPRQPQPGVPPAAGGHPQQTQPRPAPPQMRPGQQQVVPQAVAPGQARMPQGPSATAPQAATAPPPPQAPQHPPAGQVPPQAPPPQSMPAQAPVAQPVPAAPPTTATSPPTVAAPEPQAAKKPAFVMPKMSGGAKLGAPSTIPGVLDEQQDRDKDLPFLPPEPTSFEEARLNETEVEQLVLKFLFGRGEVSGRGIAAQVCLPFGMLEKLFLRMKQEQLVAYKDATAMNDYVYVLTDLGRERARRYMNDCSYYGSATVSLTDYIHSVREQSLGFQNPSRQDLQEAFGDLLINEKMFDRLGPAINSGRGMFLFGFPGNGKTSIAERVTQSFGKYIYIPRAIGLQGEIIRVFDPNYHEEAPVEESEGLLTESRVDKRWVRIKRPTVVVGGELTMAQLELQYNANNGTNEASIQLKSNCGTLVIDDFGRQKMSTDELLNRWIVPLEKRYDFLNLPSGKAVQVPFDQLVVFSTNLEPRDLVDDAFLRRIPYKIEVENPSEEEFIALFQIMCPIMGFEYDEDAVRYVIDTHYKPVDRPFRCCQPRDLLLQIKNHCLYSRQPMQLSRDSFDFAVENYFAVM